MKILRQTLLTLVLTILMCCPVFASDLAVYDLTENTTPDANIITQVNYFTSLLPAKVYEKLARNGWVVYIVDNVGNTVGMYDNNILALCVPDQRYVVLGSACQESDAILHELGHAVDAELKYPSTSRDFGLIYGEEVPIFIKTHLTAKANTATATEYFAEAFQEYIINPTYLYNNCPKTYTFINACLNSFEN